MNQEQGPENKAGFDQNRYLHPHQTERLFLRPLSRSDATAWEAFFENNDGLRFFSFDPTQPAAEKARAWVERQLWRYENNLLGLLALTDKNTNQLAGQAGLLVQEVNGKTEIEIGYHILPQLWGKGFATEAAIFLKQFARENKLTETLISIINVENFRSQRVAEKNGMQKGEKTVFMEEPVFIYRISRPF